MPDAVAPCAFRIGEQFTQALRYDADNIRAFAALAGDHNPMHHDEAFAQASRFGGLIASGGHYSAQMMGAVATYLTAKGDGLGLEFTFHFRRAVRADSTMTLTWTFTAITPKPSLGGHIVELAGTLAEADGTVAVSATSKGVVMPAGGLRQR